MVNTEEEIIGPDGDDMFLNNYAVAGIKQIFHGNVTPNNQNVDKNNINVTYKIYDNNNTLLNTINTTTDNNGEHELKYTFPHKGEYTIIANVGDDTFSLPVYVESLVDQITVSSSSNNVLKGDRITLTATVLTSLNFGGEDADVTFKITQDIDSFTEEKEISDGYELDYDVNLPKVNFECKAKGDGQCYISIIPKNSNTETILLRINTSTYKTFKVIDDGTSLKYYIDNILQGTTATGIKKLSVYGYGTVKEVTMTSHDAITANPTNINGETSANYIYPGGTCNVKAIANYGIDSNESTSITITEASALFDGITLSSDKDIISYNGGNNPESATLTAQLKKNGANANVSGQIVTFEVRKDIDDSLVETLTGTTNSSGLATVSYLGKGVGDLYVKAILRSFVSETYSIRDSIKYISDTLTSSQTLSVPNIPINFKCSFKIKADNISSSSSNNGWIEVGSDSNNCILFGNTGSYGNIGVFVKVNVSYVASDSKVSLSAQTWTELTYTYEDGVHTITDGTNTVTLNNSSITARNYVYFRNASSNRNPIKEIMFLPL